MAIPKRCEETGELIKTIITVRCNNRFDRETGEPHQGHSKRKNEFKIPSKTAQKKPSELTKKQPGFTTKCFIVLLLILISIYEPALGITLWLAIEGLAHMCSHYPKKCTANCKRPQSVSTLFSEFCAICQAQRRMDAVGKLQDRRYTQYISNILAP